jgi:hypothetical protein
VTAAAAHTAAVPGDDSRAILARFGVNILLETGSVAKPRQFADAIRVGMEQRVLHAIG